MTFYVPRHFRVDDAATLERFVEANAFGRSCRGPVGLLGEPPSLPRRARGRRTAAPPRAHGARQRALGGAGIGGRGARDLPGAARLRVPGWYANHPSVPTWNYAVVHARGTARLLAPEALPGLLDRLSRVYEDGRPAPWRMQGLPPDYTPRMLAAIVGFEIEVQRVDGKFKLSQNRPPEDVEGVADALEREGQAALAALMRAHASRPPESR